MYFINNNFNIFFLTLILLLAGFSSGYSQANSAQLYVDSLIKILPTKIEDTNKVQLLDKIAYTFSYINPNEGINYAMKAVVLAEKLNWKKGLATAYSSLATNYKAKAEFAKAVYYNLKALTIYNAIGNLSGASAVMANLSQAYRAQSNYNKALEYAFNALKIKEDLNEKTHLGIIKENIGSIYLELKDYQKTMEYFQLALTAYKQSDNKKGIARCLGNIGIVYDKKGDYSKALGYHFQALKSKQKQGDKIAIQNSLVNIAIVYTHLKNYDKALHYYEKALALSEEVGSKSSIAINLGNMGETYFLIAKEIANKKDKSQISQMQKALNLSVKNLNSAIELCNEINFTGPLIEFTEYISKAYMLQGNSDKSYQNFERYTKMKDSVFSHQNMLQITNLETKRELELKDKDIIIKNKQLEIALLASANKRKERIIFISGIIFLFLIAAWLFVNFVKRIKQRDKVLEDISQIQSHNVRGPVARILGLMQIYNENDVTDPINKEVILHLKTATHDLDEIVKKLVDKAALKVWKT